MDKNKTAKVRVFLSHNHADKPFVRMVAADLKVLGINFWLDELDISIGESLITKIADAIERSIYVAAFLSKSSINSEWVKKELALSLTQEIKNNRVVVLPLLLPGIEDWETPFFLSGKLYADFRRPELYDSAMRQLFFNLKNKKPPLRGVFIADHNDVVLPIDRDRKDRIVQIGKNPEMKEWVLDYLIKETRYDPTERYWVYIALSELGGKRSLAVLKSACSDNEENSFARRGACEGLERLL